MSASFSWSSVVVESSCRIMSTSSRSGLLDGSCVGKETSQLQINPVTRLPIKPRSVSVQLGVWTHLCGGVGDHDHVLGPVVVHVAQLRLCCTIEISASYACGKEWKQGGASVPGQTWQSSVSISPPSSSSLFSGGSYSASPSMPPPSPASASVSPASHGFLLLSRRTRLNSEYTIVVFFSFLAILGRIICIIWVGLMS